MSYLCDAIIYQLSRKTGDPYAPDFRYVNVYMNGQYEGLYLLAQKISIEGGTINDIYDLETFNNDSQGMETTHNISGGYLVELTGELGVQEVDESLRLETPHRWLRVRSPNNITQMQHEYISDLVNEAEDALYLHDGKSNASGKTWEDYFDKESWIRQYLLNEISANGDTDLGSLYFYVKDGERKLYGGPGWDYDKAFMRFLDNERMDYYLRALCNNSVFDTAKNTNGVMWLRQLDTHQEFHEDMKRYFLDIAEPCTRDIILEDVSGWETMIDESLKSDCVRWNRDYDGVKMSMGDIVNAFTERLKILHNYYSDEDDFALLTFILPGSRRNLVIPVKKGNVIAEDSLPIFEDDSQWFCGDEMFTKDTIVEQDMTLRLVP